MLTFGLELEFICIELFFLLTVTLNGDNVTKEDIWIVVKLWLKVQQSGSICDSAPIY